MKPFAVRRICGLRGEITLPGDKSIAHRSIIISSISRGQTRIENFPFNKDCLSTIQSFKKLDIKITQVRSKVRNRHVTKIIVNGKGLLGLKKPKGPIFIGESGTTFRLLLGTLAGQDFKVTLTAGKSLSQRPMLRVTNPLRMMGAKIKSKVKSQKSKTEEYPPLTIKGGNLSAITYKMPVASAQVKSAIMLAALYAKGKTRIYEPIPTRDHTERLLKLFKADIKLQRNNIVITGRKELLSPGKITIPGDISSAAFFLVMAAIIPNSRILIRNVSLNPSRIGIIKVLKKMGAKIKVKSQKSKVKNAEPIGDILVKNSKLRSVIVKKKEIPSLIDELPILMVAACFARGKTIFEGAEELRVKETDRIRSMSWNLKRMGAKIKIFNTRGSERMVIQGVNQLNASRTKSFGDHRTAMSMVVAGLAAGDRTVIDDISCINKSFPDFIGLLKSLIS
jgi:3-phosphoshikimate 1-carboxyvinyltransferase